MAHSSRLMAHFQVKGVRGPPGPGPFLSIVFVAALMHGSPEGGCSQIAPDGKPSGFPLSCFFLCSFRCRSRKELFQVFYVFKCLWGLREVWAQDSFVGSEQEAFRPLPALHLLQLFMGVWSLRFSSLPCPLLVFWFHLHYGIR